MNRELIRERDALNVELAELKETCRSISPKLMLWATSQARIRTISNRLGAIAAALRGEHDWFTFKDDDFRSCRNCGGIERQDGKEPGPCPGKVRVELRDTASV